MYKGYWREVWDKKGRLDTNDPKKLDGFEDTAIDAKEVAYKISSILGIKKSDKVLDVGCGAGMIAQHLDCDYVGVDYSSSLVKKHDELFNHHLLVAEANRIPFKDGYFDMAFAYSVFHYFADKLYVNQVFEEMRRVSRKGILIGDLPLSSLRKEHLLFNKDDFIGEISVGFYNNERFNVLIK